VYKKQLIHNVNMLNNKITDYKTINTVIAIFSAFSAIVLALAPSTVGTVFKISYIVQSNGSWFSSGRAISIMCISISLLASWSRFINEIYAQKVIMRFYGILFAGFAISNFLGGVESGVPVHSMSFGFIAVLVLMSWLCWNNSKGIAPNTKAVNSIGNVSVINSQSDEELEIKEVN